MRPWLALFLLASASAAPSAAAETVLVIGDSHTAGPFGGALDDALRAAPGNRVATYGVCSARPQSFLSETDHGCGRRFQDFAKKAPAKWLGGRVYRKTRPDGKGGTREVEFVKTPALAQLLDDHAPAAVVVALGSNLPVSGPSVRSTLARIHKSGAACVWIGPPDMRKPASAQVDEVYQTLLANGVSPTATLEESRKGFCRLVNSRGFPDVRYPAEGGDGTHYQGALGPLGAAWGKDAAAAVLAFLNP